MKIFPSKQQQNRFDTVSTRYKKCIWSHFVSWFGYLADGNGNGYGPGRCGGVPGRCEVFTGRRRSRLADNQFGRISDRGHLFTVLSVLSLLMSNRGNFSNRRLSTCICMTRYVHVLGCRSKSKTVRGPLVQELSTSYEIIRAGFDIFFFLFLILHSRSKQMRTLFKVDN